jgi:acetyltransferase-like isoleucine patch superfamily enzyme
MSHESKIVKSQFGERVSFFSGSEVENSVIGSDVVVGNDAIVIDSEISNFISINRRNYILRSRIGSFTYTGIGTSIRSAQVGKFCSLAWDISIGGGNHDFDKVTTSPLWRFHKLSGELGKVKGELEKRYDIFGETTIGNDVWIASNVIVLRHVHIGDGAIIGAGAIVTKDVPPYTVVAGVPAKQMKKRFPDHIIEAMLEIKWWDWPVDVIKANIELIYNTKVDEEVIEKMKTIKATISYAV